MRHFLGRARSITLWASCCAAALAAALARVAGLAAPAAAAAAAAAVVVVATLLALMAMVMMVMMMVVVVMLVLLLFWFIFFLFFMFFVLLVHRGAFADSLGCGWGDDDGGEGARACREGRGRGRARALGRRGRRRRRRRRRARARAAHPDARRARAAELEREERDEALDAPRAAVDVVAREDDGVHGRLHRGDAVERRAQVEHLPVDVADDAHARRGLVGAEAERDVDDRGLALEHGRRALEQEAQVLVGEQRAPRVLRRGREARAVLEQLRAQARAAGVRERPRQHRQRAQLVAHGGGVRKRAGENGGKEVAVKPRVAGKRKREKTGNKNSDAAKCYGNREKTANRNFEKGEKEKTHQLARVSD